MLLMERPLLLICLANMKPHIWILWGSAVRYPIIHARHPREWDGPRIHKETSGFGQHPTTVEVKAEWMMFRYVATPTVAEPDKDFVRKFPGTARLPEATATFDTVAVSKVTIAPISLVHPLSRSRHPWDLSEE